MIKYKIRYLDDDNGYLTGREMRKSFPLIYFFSIYFKQKGQVESYDIIQHVFTIISTLHDTSRKVCLFYLNYHRNSLNPWKILILYLYFNSTYCELCNKNIFFCITVQKSGLALICILQPHNHVQKVIL